MGYEDRNLSRDLLHHALTVAEATVAFEIACRGREGVRFIPPEEMLTLAPEATRRLRLPFRWQVEVRHGGRPYRLGVEPDRVFGLEFDGMPENRRRAYFFLEADRGTMPVVRKGLVQTSCPKAPHVPRDMAARAPQDTPRHIELPVLAVTTSRERVEHLVDACRSLAGTRLFL